MQRVRVTENANRVSKDREVSPRGEKKGREEKKEEKKVDVTRAASALRTQKSQPDTGNSSLRAMLLRGTKYHAFVAGIRS